MVEGTVSNSRSVGSFGAYGGLSSEWTASFTVLALQSGPNLLQIE